MKIFKRALPAALICILLACSLLLSSCQNVASGYKIPIVCGEGNMNKVCGVATYGVNYYLLGLKAGDMAADILLGGKTPAELPVQFDSSPLLITNTAVAEEIGFKIPDGVAAKAGADDTAKVTRVASAVVTDGADFTVGIVQIAQHEALDASNKGFVDQLSVRMDAAGKKFKILDKNASGEPSNATLIAEGFVNDKVDLIYAIATPAAQSAASATDTIPILFNAVTDPVDANLVASYESPGGNVTGVSDINPVADQIDLIAELLGNSDITIGLLYTSSEPNSIYQINLAKARCEEKGYRFVDKAISDINGIEAAFIALGGKVDAIYIPTDNTLANGAENIHSTNTGK